MAEFIANCCFGVGAIMIAVGGFLFTAFIILGLGELVLIAWEAFSNRFRDICKAESLIFEYRKNREKFLEWRAKDGN